MARVCATNRVVIWKNDDAFDASVDELFRVFVAPLSRPARIRRCGETQIPQCKGVLLAFDDEHHGQSLEKVQVVHVAVDTVTVPNPPGWVGGVSMSKEKLFVGCTNYFVRFTSGRIVIPIMNPRLSRATR